jgi:AcrR family transcriptional regulator
MSNRYSTVVDAARALLAERGAFVMDELAARAGTTKATIYRHFGSKAGVIAAAGGEAADETTARDRIVLAALRVIPRQGLAATTMQQIADEAGISPPTLYHHFANKDELLIAAVEHVADRLNPESLLGGAPSLDDPTATLGAFMARALETQVELVDFMRTMMVEVGNRPELAAVLFDRVISRMWGALSAYIQLQVAAGRFRPGHPLLRVVALAGTGIFYNLVRRNFGHRVELPPPEEAAQQFLEIFLEGVTDGRDRR